jgi:uncharacterized membrane protein
MIDVILWVMLIVTFLGVLVCGFLFFTLLRAVTRLMEKVDEIEDVLVLKQNRPQPPPNVVPLETM